jgi:hypothetical protein
MFYIYKQAKYPINSKGGAECGLEHHRRCEDAWVEQYLTAFRTFRLVENIPAVGQNIWGQQSFGPHDRNNFVWEVHRSTSPEHPHWKQQVM